MPNKDESVCYQTQDPKYCIRTNNGSRLANSVTKEPIPEDEPVFILRGKDFNALHAIIYYQSLCTDESQKNAIDNSIEAFKNFAANNPERMKNPDTE